MENMDKIHIPTSYLDQLKKQIDTYKNQEIKPDGFTEIEGYYATGEMTKGQASKIKSFYDNFAPSDKEQKAKYDTYGGNLLRNFVNNVLTSAKTKKVNAQHLRTQTGYPGQGSQTGRQVDRMSKPSLASTMPSKIATHKELYSEEIQRIKQLMCL